MASILAKEIAKNTKHISSLTRNSNLRLLATSTSNSIDNCREYDVVVVGGGIVGAAGARELILRHGNLKMAIVEKEDCLAKHQSGHNSGVIHAGIYYKPGTLKAKLCVEGLRLMYEYCDSKEIPYKKVGKLIVATNELERKRLADLHERGIQNRVPDLQLLKGIDAIRKVEPYCQGLEALWSPQTGIVDYVCVTNSFVEDFKSKGGDLYLNFEVNGFKESHNQEYPVKITSKSNKQTLLAKYVLTCGGLQSDLVSELSGCDRTPRILPFRGEYLLLSPEKTHMIKGNIYPVPDPKFPFLGVHFTPRMDGSVWLGPNAILAFKREGYTYSDINVRELLDALLYPGFQKLALKYAVFGAKEMLKSIFISRQIKDLQKFIPDITVKDVRRGPAGVRAQALDVNGGLVDDFIFDLGKGCVGTRILHCRNAPSPGATSSMAIARMMADKVQDQFNLRSLRV